MGWCGSHRCEEADTEENLSIHGNSVKKALLKCWPQQLALVKTQRHWLADVSCRALQSHKLRSCFAN